MKLKYTTSVIVNMDLYYVFIICDRIIREEPINEYCPPCLKFYKKGELVARIPERNIDDLEWYESTFSMTKTIVLRQSFKNVF